MPRPRESPDALLAMGLSDPFDAIPSLLPGVESITDAKGRLQLRRVMPPKPGIYARVSRLLRFEHVVRVDLDEQGSFFWTQIDGRSDLRGIADAMSRHFQLDRRDCREAVIRFSRSLMLRKLVYFVVRAKENTSADYADDTDSVQENHALRIESVKTA